MNKVTISRSSKDLSKEIGLNNNKCKHSTNFMINICNDSRRDECKNLIKIELDLHEIESEIINLCIKK